MTKDYYKILDITEFSTQDEIKHAYRRLARKWHPDVAGNTDYVISRFKDINEAYEILSDEIRKTDYDKARRFYKYASEQSESNTEAKTETKNNSTNPNTKTASNKTAKKESKKNFSFNWEDFIAKKYRETQYKKEQQVKAPKRGADISTDVEITILEAIEGTTKIINMLQTNVCPKCGGRKFVNGAQCAECKGKGEVSVHKRFNVRIPSGIKDGSKIRLAGEGEKGVNGGKPGDLYLIIHVQKNSNFKTDGLNLLKTVQITPYEAVLGTNIIVLTPNGKLSVKIAPNTKNGQKIRLNNCGIEQNNNIGDMILIVEIQVPTNLSLEELELYKKLKELDSGRAREY